MSPQIKQEMNSTLQNDIFKYLFIGVSVLAAALSGIITYRLLHLREAIKGSALFRLILVVLNLINPVMVLAMVLKIFNEEDKYDDICKSVSLFLIDEVFFLSPLLLLSILVQCRKATFCIELTTTIVIIILSLGFPVMIYLGVYNDYTKLYHYYLTAFESTIAVFLLVMLLIYFCTFKENVKKAVKLYMLQFWLVMMLRVAFQVTVGLLKAIDKELIINILDVVIFLVVPVSTCVFLLAVAKEYEEKTFGAVASSLLKT
eukprot:TRINITY_DN16018_c0_g1_i1.p1 TRINITY_DN16018_c0_g1~~TRINITY_DN16018_c0_g1_i1.p1  ORF type:complete len:259 (+),score=51.76 TRINITY_DN16018_c0_g1_i1:116-892(+)